MQRRTLSGSSSVGFTDSDRWRCGKPSRGQEEVGSSRSWATSVSFYHSEKDANLLSHIHSPYRGDVAGLRWAGKFMMKWCGVKVRVHGSRRQGVRCWAGYFSGMNGAFRARNARRLFWSVDLKESCRRKSPPTAVIKENPGASAGNSWAVKRLSGSSFGWDVAEIGRLPLTAAGDLATRKLTSGAIIMPGEHWVKTWSTDQSASRR